MEPNETESTEPAKAFWEDMGREELFEHLYSNGVSLGYWEKAYHHSKPDYDFLERFEETFSWEEPLPEEDEFWARRQRRKEIEEGSPLSEKEIAMYDRWLQEKGFDDLETNVYFFEESAGSGQYWIACSSLQDPPEWVVGPFDDLESAVEYAADICPWDFAESTSLAEIDPPASVAVPRT